VAGVDKILHCFYFHPDAYRCRSFEGDLPKAQVQRRSLTCNYNELLLSCSPTLVALLPFFYITFLIQEGIYYHIIHRKRKK
jgi:hypothetical protein